MKKSSYLYNENKITEILASAGFIFPRNKIELQQFEILFGNNNFGLTGQEIDPEVILSSNRTESKTIKLSEARNHMADDSKLVARVEEESFKLEIENYFKKSNKKKDLDEE